MEEFKAMVKEIISKDSASWTEEERSLMSFYESRLKPILGLDKFLKRMKDLTEDDIVE